jgi:hypothetical protein
MHTTKRPETDRRASQERIALHLRRGWAPLDRKRRFHAKKRRKGGEISENSEIAPVTVDRKRSMRSDSSRS